MYKNKYEKYKQKYIILKNQQMVGGANDAKPSQPSQSTPQKRKAQDITGQQPSLPTARPVEPPLPPARPSVQPFSRPSVQPFALPLLPPARPSVLPPALPPLPPAQPAQHLPHKRKAQPYVQPTEPTEPVELSPQKRKALENARNPFLIPHVRLPSGIRIANQQETSECLHNLESIRVERIRFLKEKDNKPGNIKEIEPLVHTLCTIDDQKMAFPIYYNYRRTIAQMGVERLCCSVSHFSIIDPRMLTDHMDPAHYTIAIGYDSFTPSSFTSSSFTPSAVMFDVQIPGTLTGSYENSKDQGSLTATARREIREEYGLHDGDFFIKLIHRNGNNVVFKMFLKKGNNSTEQDEIVMLNSPYGPKRITVLFSDTLDNIMRIIPNIVNIYNEQGGEKQDKITHFVICPCSVPINLLRYIDHDRRYIVTYNKDFRKFGKNMRFFITKPSQNTDDSGNIGASGERYASGASAESGERYASGASSLTYMVALATPKAFSRLLEPHSNSSHSSNWSNRSNRSNRSNWSRSR